MRLTLIAASILAAFALASWAVLGVLDSRARNAEQRVQFCQEIENLKAAQREAARLNFNRLDETLRLLNVKKTPSVERVARRNRDEALRRFAARECR